MKFMGHLDKILFIFLCSCQAAYVRVGRPGSNFDPSVMLGASAEFGPANLVFKQKCSSCHPSFANFTEAQWIASGNIVPGNPEQSLVFSVLKNSNVGGAESMPPAMTLLDVELQAIRNWIFNVSSSVASNVSPAEQRWLAAQVIISSKCVSCHAQDESPRFQAISETEMLSHGSLIIAGDAARSKLYKQLLKTGDDAMPPSPAAPLSAQQIQTIRDWIDNI